MKWQWKLGKFAGIDVFVHATFFLLIGWIGFTSWIQENSIVAVASGVGFILALFFSVVLHEYGHALTARRYGVKTRDITLYPIGGVARLERIPDVPIQELWISLAGPAVNVVIAGLLFIGLNLASAIAPSTGLTLTAGAFIERLMLTNLLLVAFNLIPAFPMDGGRVLRAVMALRLEYNSATRIAATVGQAVAVVFGIVGIFYNPFLILIAFFVFIGARSEAQMVRMKSAISGVPVRRAMLTEFRALAPNHFLGEVVYQLRPGSQREYPVVDGGRVVGMLKRSAISNALQTHGGLMTVGDVMSRTFETIDAHDMLDKAFARLQAGPYSSLPVLQFGELVGLLTTDSLSEFVRIQSMLSG
ncbi:MAG: site-2 protease family protein, partial [Anaerolineales bacterium]|nr:site-2 protease family protein [Anaerolineales bacterium]